MKISNMCKNGVFIFGYMNKFKILISHPPFLIFIINSSKKLGIESHREVNY